MAPGFDPSYAEDITDLSEAQRVIAELQRMLAQAQELNAFADGQFTLFLDDEHTAMLLALFEQRRLVAQQSAASELHDVLADFVSCALDQQWEARWNERRPSRKSARPLTSSA